jgi:hypothetical protein
MLSRHLIFKIKISGFNGAFKIRLEQLIISLKALKIGRNLSLTYQKLESQLKRKK